MVRKDRLSAVILLLIPIALFADVLFLSATLYFRDLTFYFYPANRVLREIVLGGEFPFWNPFFSAGQPLASNPEFSTFYPLRWLILLPEYDSAFNLHILVHVPIGLLGMYHLLRSLRARPEASLLGALSFGISGFFLSYLSIPPFLFALAWVPSVIAFSARFLSRPALGSLALAALVWGLQLTAGEPTVILQTGIMVGALGTFAGVSASREGRAFAVVRSLALVAVLAVASLAVAAVQMLPAAAHVRESSRAGGLSWDMVRFWSTPPVRAAEMLYPALMGPTEDEFRSYWGSRLYRQQREPYLQSIYFGLPLMAFAIAGIVARRRGVVLTLIVSAAGLLLAVGEHTPLLRALYDIGIFRSFRYPEKFMLLALFPLIVFGALMLDRATRGDRKVRRIAAVAAASSAVVALAAWAATWSGLYEEGARWFWGFDVQTPLHFLVETSRAGWGAAVLRGAALCVLILALPRLRRPVWTAVAATFLLIDLGSLSAKVLPRTHERFFEAPASTASMHPDRNSYRIIHQAYLEEQASMVAPRWKGSASYLLWRNAMYPRLPVAWGFATVHDPDYDETNLRPTVELHQATLAFLARQRSRWPGPLAAMSNARYVVRHPPGGVYVQRPGDNPEFLQPLEVIDVGPSDRYYFASGIDRVDGWRDFAARLLAGTIDARAAYVGFPPRRVGRGIVATVRESANIIELDVETRSESYLVLSVTPHKYWRATIDGAPATLHVTNIGYQGLWVPEGDHTVRLVYRNTLVIVSAIVSALSVMAFLTLAIVFRRRP